MYYIHTRGSNSSSLPPSRLLAYPSFPDHLYIPLYLRFPTPPSRPQERKATGPYPCRVTSTDERERGGGDRFEETNKSPATLFICCSHLVMYSVVTHSCTLNLTYVRLLPCEMDSYSRVRMWPPDGSRSPRGSIEFIKSNQKVTSNGLAVTN